MLTCVGCFMSRPSASEFLGGVAQQQAFAVAAQQDLGAGERPKRRSRLKVRDVGLPNA